MLFKKTVKAASAAALWMVALMGANSAMAQMLDTYSAETLTAAAGTKDFPVESAADMTAHLAIAKAGVRFDLSEATDTEQLFLRVAPSGMKFAAGANPTIVLQTAADAAAVTAGTWTTAAGAVAAAGEDANGDALTFAIGQSGGTAVVRTAHAVRFLATITARTGDGAGSEALVSSPGTAGITLALYEKERDAYLGEGTPLATGGANFFNVMSSIEVKGATAAAVKRTAASTEQFRQFIADDRTGMKTSLGGFDVQVNAKHLIASTGLSLAATHTPADDGDAATEEVLNLAAVYTAVGIDTAKSSSKFSGAGGQGFAYASKFELNSEGDCSGTGPSPGKTGITSYPGMEVDEGEDAPDPNEVVGGIAPNPWHLCVTVDADNTETIPMGGIDMDVTLADNVAATMTRLVSPAASSVMGMRVANIVHDGTTVQIPYVTTYEGYTQRIVIMNRAKNDVNYTLTFQTEEGITAMPGEVTGTAMGGMTTVLKVDELDITLEGGKTRASATLILTGSPGTIDVAITQVNKMDQSTDTVVLESRGN